MSAVENAALGEFRQSLIGYGLLIGQLKAIPWNLGQFQSKPKICEQFDIFCRLRKSREVQDSKTLFTWSGGPRSSGVGFFCFVSPRARKQKKPTPLDRSPPLHVNRALRKSVPASSQSPNYCWFARDVKAAMLDEKNKSISFLWELNSIFM